MTERSRVVIRWDPPNRAEDDVEEYTFDTRHELDAFMEGLAAAEDNGLVDYETVFDSREKPAGPAQYIVRFYKDFTTRDRCTITVTADSPTEARNKVAEWGLTGDGLTDAEMSTETIDRQGEVQDSTFYGLAEEGDPYAVIEKE